MNNTFNNAVCSERSCLESFAMKFTNDVEDANDLVQDTLIKAIRNHHLYKPGTNLRAWLYTLMKNTFINDYRQGPGKMQLPTLPNISHRSNSAGVRQATWLKTRF